MKCHLCQRREPEVKDVRYCAVCDHWFCEACRGRWFERGAAFLAQMVGGRKPGCCGRTDWIPSREELSDARL